MLLEFTLIIFKFLLKLNVQKLFSVRRGMAGL